MVISRVSKSNARSSSSLLKDDKKKHKNVSPLVEKHVRQLGEKSNRKRIISRLDGTAVFGREYGRERVWGEWFFVLSFFLCILFVSSKQRVNVVLSLGMNGHIFCPFRIF